MKNWVANTIKQRRHDGETLEQGGRIKKQQNKIKD